MKVAVCCSLLMFSMSTFAGIQVDATRVIYNGGNQSASLSLTNDSEETYMVQSWLDTGDATQTPKGLPIVVTPPILKLASNKEAVLRFIYSGQGLPQNKESLFWINVQEIPPAPKLENVLQVAIRTRIKLFYRPAALQIDLNKQAQALKWQRSGDDMVVTNTGPAHITLGVLNFAGNGQKACSLNGEMVKPEDSLRITLPLTCRTANELSFSFINDYGGHTEIKGIRLDR
ncbi:pili assembly chaperone [Pseudomonas fluorescens]|nr:pili assembly chaperone [Pseudomonas fluorescens]